MITPHGTRLERIDELRVQSVLAPYKRVAVDLGTGDGRFAYDRARRNPDTFSIGIDPNAGAMASYATKALRKLAKGGLSNVLYAIASIEELPVELAGVASHVSIMLPWGSLLRAVALPDVELLRNVRALCRGGATLDVVLGYDCARERNEIERLALPELSQRHIEGELSRGYREAGFRIERAERLSRDDLRALPSTWAKRVAFGRPRDVWRIEARAFSHR